MNLRILGEGSEGHILYKVKMVRVVLTRFADLSIQPGEVRGHDNRVGRNIGGTCYFKDTRR